MSPEKTVQLVELWTGTNKPGTQVAAELDITRDALREAVHRMGLKPTKTRPVAAIARTSELIRSEIIEREPGPLPVTGMAPGAIAVPRPLWELSAQACRWPVNDGGPFLFCAEPRIPGCPYCAHHRDVARGRK